MSSRKSISDLARLPLVRTGGALALAALAVACGVPRAQVTAQPMTQVALAPVPAGERVAVFAGGCFWGVEAVYEHVKGVTSAVSGYAGGSAETANYDEVSSGRSGHAEAVRVTYDPKQVSYKQLLEIYFLVAHNPTQLNYQGPDRGPQYRSAIFFTGEEQKQQAQAVIDRLAGRAYREPIVTQVVPLTAFYPAEKYHQDFLARNPTYPYIVVHDLPKLEQLKKQFPALYRS